MAPKKTVGDDLVNVPEKRLPPRSANGGVREAMKAGGGRRARAAKHLELSRRGTKDRDPNRSEAFRAASGVVMAAIRFVSVRQSCVIEEAVAASMKV